MTEPKFIASNTTASYTTISAPDRNEVAVLGGVSCHYALKANENPTHPEQQDRAAVYTLPKHTKPEGFKGIFIETFKGMMDWQSANVKLHPEFIGDTCATLACLDPKSGKLAIGSKGDAAVYIVIQNKQKPDDIIIKRISSPYARIPNGQFDTLNSIGKKFPPMWARMDSWKNNDILFNPNSGAEPPAFELINLKILTNNILHEAHPRLKKFLGMIKNTYRAQDDPSKHYHISLIIASDGIIDNLKIDEIEPRLKEISGLFKNTNVPHTNLAQNILDYVTSDSLKTVKSEDNLSAIVLPNLTFGKGDCIAACICDGHYKKSRNKTTTQKDIRDGTIAADKMIGVFEKVIKGLPQANVQSTQPPSSWKDFVANQSEGIASEGPASKGSALPAR